MRRNRNLPFGYEIRDGMIQINRREAVIVQRLFREYIDGSPFQKLADHMNAQEIPYNTGNTRWNKNTVARIIGCEAYLGKSGLPVIITDEEYRMAMSVKQSRTLVGEQDTVTKCIRRLSRCSACGGELRIRDGRWKCKQCDALTYKAKTPEIMEQCREICRSLREERYEISEPPSEQSQKSMEIAEREEALREMLDSEDFDESSAERLALGLAEKRYAEIGSERYETRRIRYLLENTLWTDDVDVGLLQAITSAILIRPDGTVGIKLKNGQILERMETI